MESIAPGSDAAPRARLTFWLRLGFGVAVLAVALSLVDLAGVLDVLVALSPAWFLAALAVNTTGTILVPALITSITLRAGDIRIGLLELLRINLTMRFYVLVLPHAATVALRWARYRGDTPGTGWQAATLIGFERLVQFTVIVLFAFVFLAAAHPGLPAALTLLLPVSAAAVLFGAVALGLFLSARGVGAARRRIERVALRGPRAVGGRVQRLFDAVQGFQRLGARRAAATVAWAMVGHLLFVGSAYLVAIGMGLPVGFVEIGWMRSAVLLLSLLPITVGGLGVREAGFAGLLYLYGVDRATALAFPLVLLAIQLAIGSIGALLEAARLIRMTRRRRAPR